MTQKNYKSIKKYGNILFYIALNRKEQEKINYQLNLLKCIISSNSKITYFLSDKDVKLLYKEKVLATLKKPFDILIQNLIQILYDYNHFNYLLDIIDDYNQRFDNLEKIINVNVITAVLLSNEQKNKLQNILIKKFNAKKVNINSIVNKDIMGGVIIKTKDIVIDGSISTRMLNLKNYLLSTI